MKSMLDMADMTITFPVYIFVDRQMAFQLETLGKSELLFMCGSIRLEIDREKNFQRQAVVFVP